jgi:hypothetical protein
LLVITSIVILLISASQVIRIICMSHWHLDYFTLLILQTHFRQWGDSNLFLVHLKSPRGQMGMENVSKRLALLILLCFSFLLKSFSYNICFSLSNFSLSNYFILNVFNNFIMFIWGIKYLMRHEFCNYSLTYNSTQCPILLDYLISNFEN